MSVPLDFFTQIPYGGSLISRELPGHRWLGVIGRIYCLQDGYFAETDPINYRVHLLSPEFETEPEAVKWLDERYEENKWK